MGTRNCASAGNTITRRVPAAGSVAFSAGEIAMKNTSGFYVRGFADTTLLPGGIVEKSLNTTGATDGQLSLEVGYAGYYHEVDNSTGADAVLSTDQDSPVYVLDANSVSRLSSGKSKLGIFKGFSASGRVRVQILPN